jgi:peptide/nickel transport system ATP-binding protein
MPLLTIRDLTVEYPGRKGTFTAVEAADLTLERGEIVGLVGESGAGKSTIGVAVMGLVDRPGRIARGRIELEGERIDGLGAAAMRRIRGRRIAMIFQDPLTSLDPLQTVERQLVETIRVHDSIGRGAARHRAVGLLSSLGIADAETRIGLYPHEYSGGMRQRVVIALALACDPDVIFADEPTTALDVSVQAQILALIRRQVRERQIGILLATHDMGVIAETADRVAVMHRGRIVEIGPTRQVIEEPRHPYTRRLIAAVPRSDVTLRRFPVVADEGDAAAQPALDLASHWLGAGSADHQPGEQRTLVAISGLSVRFPTRRALLPSHRRWHDAVADVDLAVQAGETLGLVGESGSGKSTIARVLAGLQRPSGGTIRFDGADVAAIRTAAERQAFHRQIQMIFQDPYSSLNPRMRVRDIVAEPILHHGLARGRAEVDRIVADLLERVRLGAAMGRRYPHEFSGGQRQRISIARALATKPRFLVCDEPTSSLDVSIQAQILNLLKDLQEQLELTILFISHDLPVIRQMCHRVAVLKDGRICEVAATDDLFDRPQHPYTRELLARMPRLHRPPPDQQGSFNGGQARSAGAGGGVS